MVDTSNLKGPRNLRRGMATSEEENEKTNKVPITSVHLTAINRCHSAK